MKKLDKLYIAYTSASHKEMSMFHALECLAVGTDAYTIIKKEWIILNKATKTAKHKYEEERDKNEYYQSKPSNS